MKLLCISNLTAIVSLLLMHEFATFNCVSADIMVRFIFNNGVSPSSNTSCSDVDYDKIDTIFSFENVNRRHLRYSNLPGNENNAKDTTPRELRSFSRTCKKHCSQYASGTCRATNCVGYRRALSRVERNEQSVSVNVAKTCSESLNVMQTQLDALISNNLVSAPCQLFLKKSNRISTCYDDIVYGEVEGYRIWNLTSSGGKTSPYKLHESDNMTVGSGGYSFCKRTVFNVEIMTNPCVENVQISTVGPRRYKLDRTEGYQPYTVFSGTTSDNTDISTGRIILLGTTMPYVGSYHVTVVPDGIPTKKTQFDFTILDC